MNRGLIGFLAFLAVLLFGFGVAAYVLGPNVLAFVFHAERRTEPVVIVSLLDFADEQHAAAYHENFERPAAALIKTLGGHPVWKASAGDVVRGQVLDGWSTLELVGYPSRSAFIELVTSSDYRALLDARAQSLKRSAVLSATPAVDFDTQGTQAQAVRFLSGAHDDSIAVYESKWLAEDEKLLAAHEGKSIWRARLNPLAAEPEQRFGEILIYGFSDAQHREDWAADAERETLQTLQRRLFKRDVLVLANAQMPVEATDSAGANAGAGEPPAETPDEAVQGGSGESPAASQQTPSNAP